MADREDWVEWDNSMKAHIDQVEVKWRHDLIGVLKNSAEIQQLQAQLNDDLIKAADEAVKKHQRTVIAIGLCFCLMIINLGVAVIAIREVYAP